MDELASIASQLIATTSRGDHPINISQAHPIILAWSIRLSFLNHVAPKTLSDFRPIIHHPDSSHTPFQLLRILFQRGLHEPSQRQKSTLPSPFISTPYVCPSLESTEWWDSTIATPEGLLSLPIPLLEELLDFAARTPLQSHCPLFPQHLPADLLTNTPLQTADPNAARIKLYLHQNPTLIQFDPNRNHLKSEFPPEDMHREYKATFRFDTSNQQKNPAQQFACLKTICAFLNAQGGTLIIGIDDTLSPIGISGDLSLVKSPSPQDALQQIIAEAIKTAINPYPHSLYTISFLAYGPHQLISISVSPSPSKPHFLHQKDGSTVLYVRSGNRTLQLKNQAQSDYLNQLQSKP